MEQRQTEGTGRGEHNISLRQCTYLCTGVQWWVTEPKTWVFYHISARNYLANVQPYPIPTIVNIFVECQGSFVSDGWRSTSRTGEENEKKSWRSKKGKGKICRSVVIYCTKRRRLALNDIVEFRDTEGQHS